MLRKDNTRHEQSDLSEDEGMPTFKLRQLRTLEESARDKVLNDRTKPRWC